MASDGPFRFLTERSEVVHLDTSDKQLNVDIIAKLLECWTCLLADSPLNVGRVSKKPSRTFFCFQKKFKAGPLKDFILSFASLADELLASATLPGAGPSTKTWISAFAHTPVFEEYRQWYLTDDPVVFRWLLTFLWFGKKLDYHDETLYATAFRGWLEVEKRLSDLKLSPEILSGIKVIMTELLRTYSAGDLMPKFGPKTVAEPLVRGRIQKSNHLLFHPRLDRVLFTGHFACYGLLEEKGFHPNKVIPDPSKWNNASAVSGDTSELLFVPKNVKTARSICREPNSFMFAQQAILHSWKRSMERRDSLIRRFVNLTDQGRNRDLAKYGSFSGTIDTIDLSSASDSVSTQLVKKIFSGNRRLLHALLGTRTSTVLLPNGETMRVEKFAPMGSALCFPVQCHVFTAVAIYAAMQLTTGTGEGSAVPTDSPWLKDVHGFVNKYFRRDCGLIRPGDQAFEPLSVFGDDICVDHKLTRYVIHLLTALGFEVNISKSFTGDQSFRESCGGYYLNGEDVTPLFFRVKWYRGKIGPESVASMIAGANHAGDRRLLNLRRCLVQTLLFENIEGVWRRKNHTTNDIAFSNDRSKASAIYTLQPRNSHLNTRTQPDRKSVV